MFRIGIDIQNDLRAQAGERICLEMGLLDMAAAKAAPQSRRYSGNRRTLAPASREKKNP